MAEDDRFSLPRRTLLRWGAGAGIAATLAPISATGAASSPPQVRRYVELGRTGLKISDVSFGTSRLRSGQENLIAHALERGINYFDSADGYTGGASETVLGNALKGKRDQAVLVSKVQTGASATRDEFMETLESSLRRLQTDYVDIYMCHAVNDVARLKSPEWQAFTERAKQQGKIRFAGASGHAGRLIECLDYAIDADIVDVILVAHNFGQDPAFYEGLTRSFDFVAKQPDLPRVLAKAKQKNVGVVAMKTLMGAKLNDMRPYEQGSATFSQAAFRWVLSNPHVDALVISMTSTALIDEYLGASGWQQLALGDRALLEQYAMDNGKTYCRHVCNDCEGSCPYGVPIADVLRTRMYATDYKDMAFAREEYALLTANASACLSCTAQPCQSACTHGLPIAQMCAPTHRMLA